MLHPLVCSSGQVFELARKACFMHLYICIISVTSLVTSLSRRVIKSIRSGIWGFCFGKVKEKKSSRLQMKKMRSLKGYHRRVLSEMKDWRISSYKRNLRGAAVPCHGSVAAADTSAASAEKQAACTSGRYRRGSAPFYHSWWCVWHVNTNTSSHFINGDYCIPKTLPSKSLALQIAPL